MKFTIAYGRHGLDVELPEDRTTVIEPIHVSGLADEKQSLFDAVDNPIGCNALKHQLKPGGKVCITFTDITRATPNERIIPWLLEYIEPYVPKHNIILLNSLGTHRPNTREELCRMLGNDVVEQYRIVDNEPENETAHVQFGATGDGTPVLINRHLAEADVRIVTGFIEPHFFAGFSGGPKGIVPGSAHLRTVMSNHAPRNISHPNAAFGISEGNPLWEEMRNMALRIGPSFLLNVTLNEQKQITGVFAGDLQKAHQKGREFVRRTAMKAVDQPFDIVLTTNSGYPLDMNLYQGVKGISAASRIVKPGGLIILACECCDGLPANSSYERILRAASTPAQLVEQLASRSHVMPDQWQVQIQAQIQMRAEVMVYSSLSPELVKAAHFVPCPDIAVAICRRLDELGPDARVAVMPQGPLSIPYIGSVGI